MHVVMIGAGYVGLVSGACFADFGHRVICIDADTEKIAMLRRGKIPIYEPELEDMVARNLAAGRLEFASDLATLNNNPEVIFLAVGTPSRRGDGHADLTYVYQAAHQIAPVLKGFTVVATKSTVPVGTGDEIERILYELRPDANFVVVSNPEFLREGDAIRDFKHPDRIVIGTNDTRAQKVMSELYRPLYLNASPIFFTSRRNSELVKYAANAFLATKISFINEIADLCEQVGANVQQVARGIGMDRRIGSKFLHAGPGFGGSCFPKDLQALIKTGQDHGVPLRIIESAAAVNETRKRAMARKVSAALEGSVRGRRVAILGLTFKPNTDDMREAPSISLVRALQDMGAEVRVYDPTGEDQVKDILGCVTFCENEYSCAEGADAIVIMTEWEQFRALDLARLKLALRQPILVDLRNIYPADEVLRQGFKYIGIGRGDFLLNN